MCKGSGVEKMLADRCRTEIGPVYLGHVGLRGRHRLGLEPESLG